MYTNCSSLWLHSLRLQFLKVSFLFHGFDSSYINTIFIRTYFYEGHIGEKKRDESRVNAFFHAIRFIITTNIKYSLSYPN